MRRVLKRLALATGTYPLVSGVLARLRRALAAFAETPRILEREPPPAQTIPVDYPVDPRPRWGYGRPSHPELSRILEEGRARYAELLGSFLPFRRSLAQIPLREDPDDWRTPNWDNGMLPALDAIALYSLLALREPSLYIEVGSGNSTKFARRAVDDQQLATKVVSVDPHPRAECDRICDEIIREPFERIDLGLFDRVGPGDVVFLDGSHRCFTNSDATVFFIDVMPFLPSGALVHIHDIWLPDDYPPAWNDRYYSEQYPLATWLLAGGSTYEVLLPNHFISQDPELHGILEPIWSDPHMAGAETHGCSFWLRRR
jgi:Methyltransferase domain